MILKNQGDFGRKKRFTTTICDTTIHMAHILIVCTANICRSPLVEAMLRHDLHEQGYTDWTLSSAGTWAQQARPAARYSQRLAKRIGLDLKGHIAQEITAELVANSDLVIVMTDSHKEPLQIEFSEHQHKVFKLSEMVGRKYDVVDPYGGPDEGYESMFVEVTDLITRGLPRIIELAQENAKARVA